MTEKPAGGSGTSFGEGWSIEEAEPADAVGGDGERVADAAGAAAKNGAKKGAAAGAASAVVDAEGAATAADTAADTAATAGRAAEEEEPEGQVAAGEPQDAEAASAPAQLSNFSLVVLGLLGGVYLIYSWVWLSWTKFYADQYKQIAQGSGSVGAVLDQIVFWTAPAAPLLWFTAVLILARRRRVRVRFIWLLVGLFVTLPYQFFAGVGA